MCGIYGYFHLDAAKQADASQLAAMGDSLRHRGPDDEGMMVNRNVAMGHKRLSIIDLSPEGRQPMCNEDGTVWIVFNGEIYNFADYREDLIRKGHRFRSRTDTEVILHLYEEWGADCLQYLNGMFAFVLWNKAQDEVLLVRDRQGIKPLHYARRNGQIVFGSEIKSLLRHPAVGRDMDMNALNEFLSFEYVPAPRSIFRDIRKVLPGHYLRVRKGDVSEIKYWEVHYPACAVVRPEQEYAEELRTLLADAVSKQLVADVPVGAFLSGGVDSSAVVAFMAQKMPGRVKTFNIGFEESSFDESEFAERVARHLGTEHRTNRFSVNSMLDLIPRMYEVLDEPFADASFLPTWLLAGFARQEVKVSLSGDGGDELFAGYPTYVAHRFAACYGRIPRPLRRLTEAAVNLLPVSDEDMSLDFRLKKTLSALAVASPARRNYQWLGSFAEEEKEPLLTAGAKAEMGIRNAYDVAEAYYGTCGSEDELEKILHCDRRFYLQDDMLVKIDRATMAASLEGRVPLLDHRIVEFAARLPRKFKMRGLQTKYLLKKAAQPFLPAEVLKRPKKGFGVPLAKWFKRELAPLARELFALERIRRQGIFQPEELGRLLREHAEGRADHRKKLYTLLSFQLWHDKYAS